MRYQMIDTNMNMAIAEQLADRSRNTMLEGP